MGVMKAWKMEQEERGYWSVGDKYVCADCFDDYAISQFITDHAVEKKCDYCGQTSSRRRIAAPMDDVIGHIVEGIKYEWGQPDNEGVPYESAEGGYQGEVIDNWELLFDELAIVDDCGSELADDLRNAIMDCGWCQRNFFGLPPDKALIYGWEEFCQKVKGQTRYTFFRARDLLRRYRGPEEIPASRMLDELGSVIAKTNMLLKVRKGTRIIRVRPTEAGQRFVSATDLGSPPLNKALQSNRMSPAGISMFYGTFDQETAILETCKGVPYATVGHWETLRPFWVVDLTELPPVPSLFDVNKRGLRPAIKFLHSFVGDLSKPIDPDTGQQEEHVEYVPTQIVTEYFRFLFRYRGRLAVKGLYYRSSRTGKKTCVLFFENEDCCDQKPSSKSRFDEPKWLRLVRHSRRSLTSQHYPITTA